MQLERMKTNLILTLIFLLTYSLSFACDCEPWYDKVEDWSKTAPIAIEGEIISTKYIGKDDTIKTVNDKGDTLMTVDIDETAYDLYQVKVKMNFKNKEIDSIITVKSVSNSSCSAYFQLNKSYIIFASKTEQGAYYTDVCYGSRLSNKNDIEAINKIK